MTEETFSAEHGHSGESFREDDTDERNSQMNTLPVILEDDGGSHLTNHSEDTVKVLTDITATLPRQACAAVLSEPLHLSMPDSTSDSQSRIAMELPSDLTLSQANVSIADANTTATLIKLSEPINEAHHHDFHTQSEAVSILTVGQANINQSHVQGTITLTTINQSDIGDHASLGGVTQSQLFQASDGQSVIDDAHALGQISAQHLLTNTNILTVNANSVSSTSALGAPASSQISQGLPEDDGINLPDSTADRVSQPAEQSVHAILVQDTGISSDTANEQGGEGLVDSSGEDDSNQCAKKAKKIFMCQVCKKTFSSQTSLKSHLMTHMGARPFKCDLCSATFNRMGNYTRHRLIHTVNTNDDHRYKCEFCDRKFLQKCDLKRHQHIHDGTQPFRCDLCDKGFIRKSDLRVHKRFHTKEKPYVCPQCPKSFSQSGDLNRHVRSLHSNPESLKCGHCKKTYVKEATLIRHMQTAHQDILKSVALKLQKNASQLAAETERIDDSMESSATLPTQEGAINEDSSTKLGEDMSLDKPDVQ
ncbi:uncharacterized protein [Ptychodera flava]|uniref:uncharacterized protein n=1 Tax=Ptychodera flava TaxID=63121 RepID=UPI003969F2FC